VVCPSCNHLNPDENRFCGMCGTALSPGRLSEPEPENVVEKVPFTWQRSVPATRDNVAEPVRAEEVHRTAPAPPKPVARVEEPALSNHKWWVEDGETAVERETTVGGPSFLGLSGGENGESGGYSYLFEDEKQSHAGRWVFLLVLLALGAALYWKWQPIRDFVLTTAISHSRPQAKPAQETNAAPAAATDTAAPTTTLATNDTPSQPSITTENKTEQNKAASPSSTPKEGLPEADKQSSASSTSDDTAKSKAAGTGKEPAANAASKQPSSKPAPKGDGASAEQPDEESANADDEKPSAGTQKARAAQTNPGGDLVSTGERYLYGRGVARSCDQAVSYFNAAAAKQNPQAFSHLGALYATGNCVPMDRAAAYAWFRRAYAKEPGNHYFEQNLTMLWREMSPDERQRAARQ
jgi:hypothetical protein